MFFIFALASVGLAYSLAHYKTKNLYTRNIKNIVLAEPKTIHLSL